MSIAHAVLMPGFSGTSLPAWVARALAENLAGVILFAENVPDIETARHLTDEIRAAGPDAVVASDEEGGDVSRLEAATGSSIPGNAALGILDDEGTTRRVAAAYGRLIAVAGIDVALGPVLDVASEPLNPVVGVRSFGADAALVGRHGRAFVEGLREAGVASVGKHFPGHGATNVDSHVGLPILTADQQTLRDRDEQPFLDAGPDGVMVAHVVVPERGPDPATLSRWAYQGARDLGHPGPLVTDALGMRAITQSLELGEACVRALAAGADLLLLDAPHQSSAEADFYRARTAIEQAVGSGRLSESALRESARRNATLRRKPEDPLPARWPGIECAEAARAELALLGSRVASASLRSHGDVRVTGAPVVFDARRGVNYASGNLGNPLLPAFAAEGIEATPGSAGAEIGDGSRAIVLTRNPLSDPQEARALAGVLAVHPGALVVHGGVMSAAPEVKNLIAMHGIGAVNAAAAVNLMGGSG